jgi:hypothetical protein
MGWLGSSKADISYSYAQQTVTGLTVTGTGLTNGTMTGTTSSAAAVVNGVGVATNNPTDTLQAYLGAAPPAPQNDFMKYSAAGGGPQVGDFSRGDARITGSSLFAASGMSASNVAESFISTANTGPGLGTGTGSWSLAGTFTSTGTSVAIGFGWNNDILDLVSGVAASAESSFKMLITIQDQHGHQVIADPAELNTGLSAPPNNPETITSGTDSVSMSLAGLTAGDVFTISISGSELSSAQIVAVPEPGSMALAGVGGVLALAFHAIRRRNRKV